MIRNLKKFLLNNKFYSHNLKNLKKTNFKIKLYEKLNHIKERIINRKIISTYNSNSNNDITYLNNQNLNYPIEKKLNSTVNNDKDVQLLNTDKKYKQDEDTQVLSNDNKKFLKKKLQRKLCRLKRKIKRYKFTDHNTNVNDSHMSQLNSDLINDLNSKIKSLQADLGNIQNDDSLKDNHPELKRIKNKYKRKIKKLRNKLNKLDKDNKVIKLDLEKNNIQKKSKDNDTDIKDINSKNQIKDLEKQIETYKNENKYLNERLQNNDNNASQLKILQNQNTELSQKVKYYQDENIRLSSQISTQEKKLEIMRKQILSFENLKQKLYEQVNTLGDTLLDNDNVSKIFEDQVSEDKIYNLQTRENKLAINSNENFNMDTDNSIKHSKSELTEDLLDLEIKKIFNNS